MITGVHHIAMKCSRIPYIRFEWHFAMDRLVRK